MKMIDMLEDLDDVQNVYTNVEFSDEVLAQLDAWLNIIKKRQNWRFFIFKLYTCSGTLFSKL